MTLLGVGAGLGAGPSYAVFIFAFKYAAPHGSPQAILTIAFAVLSVTLFGPSNAQQTVAVLSTPDWPLFVALCVFGAGLSFIFYIVGLDRIAPAVASLVALIEPIAATLFGVVVLGERLGGWQGVGMGLILTTVTTLSLQSDGDAVSS